MPIDSFYQEKLKMEDINNTLADQLLICICADASYSMHGDRINHVNSSIRKFINQIKENIYACDTVDLCIVSFSGRGVVVENPFANVQKIQFKDLTVSGGTPLGEAVEKCLQLISDEKEKWSNVGVQLYRPWLIIMSDNNADDNTSLSAAKVQKLIHARKLKTACLNLGDKNENGDLIKYSMDGTAKPYASLEIDHFFDALSRSATGLSTAAPDEDTKDSIM